MKNNFIGTMNGSTGAIVVILVIAAVIGFILFSGNSSSIPISFPGGSSSTLIGVGSGTAGVIIKSFDISPLSIEGGDTTILTLEVENNGGFDATSIDYKIYGLSDQNSWSSVTSQLEGEKTLSAADSVRGILGGETTQEWEATSIEKRTDITYPVTVRVDYSYISEADVILQILGRDNPNIKNQNVQTSPSPQTQITNGPITITPLGSIPLIGTTSRPFTLTFQVQNIGGGRPYTDNPVADLDKIKIIADGCEVSDNFSELKLSNNVKKFNCKVTPNIDNEGEETKSINIRFEYNYVIQSQNSITVLRQLI